MEEKEEKSTRKNNAKEAEEIFRNGEYEKALEIYEKLLEKDSDNYNYIIKVGIAKSLLSNPIDFDYKSTMNAFNEALDIVKKENEPEEITDLVMQTNSALLKLKNALSSYYDRRYNNFAEINQLLGKVEGILNSFETIFAVEEADKTLRNAIINNINHTIDMMVYKRKYLYGYSNSGQPILQDFILVQDKVNELMAKRQKYEVERGRLTTLASL